MDIFNTYLEEKQPLNADVHLLTFKLDLLKHLDFKPGQYMMVHIPKDDGFINRLFSIASPSTQTDSFQLIVEYISNGAASEYFRKAQLHDHITLRGPGGVFLLKEGGKDKVFLATGTGIAPMRSMLAHLFNVEKTTAQIHLFWGLRTFQEAYLLHEFTSLAKTYPQFHFHLCLSREKTVNTVPEEYQPYVTLGRVTNGLETIFGNWKLEIGNSFDYYLCGGRTVVESLREYLATKNVDRENVIFEKF